MAMNRVDRIVLDPDRTYACTRTARTGVRVTLVLFFAKNGFLDFYDQLMWSGIEYR